MLRVLFLTTITSSFKVNCSTYSSSVASVATMSLKSVDFEVFGVVQGVFFRKYTKQEADKLDLKGWCRNTSRGTVEGQVQGPTEKVEDMKHWLRNKGSPSSRIDRADFKNDKDIAEYTFSNFEIKRDD